jgi:4a-hydroxytetrahydrobiopterin dehydratase
MPSPAPTAPQKLSEEQIEESLKRMPEWSLVGEAIQRTYQFLDFVNSMKFVATVAQQAEVIQHHPDILIRYSRVTLTLATHDASGITDKDFAMAAFSDEAAASCDGPKPAKPAKARKG